MCEQGTRPEHNGEAIKVTNEYKYLGVTLTPDGLDEKDTEEGTKEKSFHEAAYFLVKSNNGKPTKKKG